MADDNPKKSQAQEAKPPGNGHDSGPTPQQEAAIKALTDILEALKRQTQTTPQPFDGAAKAAVEEFNRLKKALEGPDPEWVLPALLYPIIRR